MDNTEKSMFTYEDIKEAVRIGVNIGMQNVEKPRHLNDFNFNQEKAIKECQEYLDKVKREVQK